MWDGVICDMLSCGVWCSGMWCGMVGYGGVSIHIHVCEWGAWYALWYDIPNQTKIHIVNDSSTSNKQEQKISPRGPCGSVPRSPGDPPPFPPLQGRDHPPGLFFTPSSRITLSLPLRGTRAWAHGEKIVVNAGFQAQIWWKMEVTWWYWKY